MRVTKRDGNLAECRFDEITARLSSLCWDLNPAIVDVAVVATKVINHMYDGIPTSKLDDLAADAATAMMLETPEYGILASRILMSNHHKNTSESFLSVAESMRDIVSETYLKTVRENTDAYQAMIRYERDYLFDDVFAFRTLEKMYLSKIGGVCVERPQHMWMRVAITLHADDIDAVKETYEYMSTMKFTHASPTLFNAGLKRQSLASCFLLGVEDSIEGIFEAFTKCAKISKFAGGIGLAISSVRAKESAIKGTNGKSDGLVPFLRVANAITQWINQGGKRKGSIAIYIEPHHADIFEVLELRRNQGDESMRARDLFYALYVSDEFMKRVEMNETWSLMDPATCPGLDDVWGDEYSALYASYETQEKYVRRVPARDVWFAVLRAQTELGLPYLVYKDACNRKSNQKNIGTIKCSNLCSEIVEYTAPDEVAVCTLGSISLPAFADAETKTFDFQSLWKATHVLSKNLDRVIDVTFYAVPEAKVSNDRHRPVGLGVQGLQNVFWMLGMPFESTEASHLNKRIFETMYHAALTASSELSQKHGTYPTFPGCPASEGLLQYDLWGVTPTQNTELDWTALKQSIKKYGLRNSLSIAPMPTASTSILFGNVEAFEPVSSNVYVRKTLAGEFVMINKYLVQALRSVHLWTSDMRHAIMRNEGSIQTIAGIPSDIKELYKTAWDISMKHLIDMAADRGAFVCQSQSLNLWMASPTFRKLSSMHMYAWRRGLKTGVYYLRSMAAAKPVQVTIPNAIVKEEEEEDEDANEVCVSCQG
jgi:ribonucleoside-diphosphate reductase alpha subunit